jgi:hypothetical protein
MVCRRGTERDISASREFEASLAAEHAQAIRAAVILAQTGGTGACPCTDDQVSRRRRSNRRRVSAVVTSVPAPRPIQIPVAPNP